MHAPLPTTRLRLFRLHIRVAFLCGLLIGSGIAAADYLHLKHLRLAEFKHVATGAELLYLKHRTSSERATSLEFENFKDQPGLTVLCVYDTKGTVVASWLASRRYNCPSLLVEEGLFVAESLVRIAQTIRQNDETYEGMVYVEGELPSLQEWLPRTLFVLAALAIIALLSSLVMAHFGARHITLPLFALRQQIECLKEKEDAFCPLAPRSLTRETDRLAHSIAGLRSYLINSTVSKETLANTHRWHWEVLSGLLSGLRHRSQADSALLADLDDYALFLQMERAESLAAPQPFLISQIFAGSVARVRKLYKPNARVTLMTSLHPSMPEHWRGHPEILETLLRHLMLIGLKRTRQGFVHLQMETIQAAASGFTHRLKITYEDSGAAVQQGVLDQLLDVRFQAAPLQQQDISWLLVSRLFTRLGGTLTGKAGAASGITLTGELPLAEYRDERLTPAPKQPEAMPVQTNPPLLLLIEEEMENYQIRVEQFHEAHCRIFMVRTHMQALTIAPILPFSAILLNACLPDAKENIAPRLRYLMEDKMMPEIPLWVSLAQSSPREVESWQRQGIREILLLPFQVERLTALCRELPPLDRQFYQQYDETVRDDLSPSILTSMPEMNRILAKQIAMLQPFFAMLAQGDEPAGLSDQAHAVKSAALSLGYFRLAALMGEIEHARASYLFASYPPNWQIIADLLGHTLFDT